MCGVFVMFKRMVHIKFIHIQNGLWQLSLIEKIKARIIVDCHSIFDEKLGKISDETYIRSYEAKTALDLLRKDLKALYIF